MIKQGVDISIYCIPVYRLFLNCYTENIECTDNIINIENTEITVLKYKFNNIFGIPIHAGIKFHTKISM